MVEIMFVKVDVFKNGKTSPVGFPGLSNPVVEPVDFKVGGLSGDFTGEELPCLKPKTGGKWSFKDLQTCSLEPVAAFISTNIF